MTNKITHKNTQYDKGKFYMSDDGRIGELVRFDGSRFHLWNGFREFQCVSLIQLSQSCVGTITDAPIELEEGCWYMCELRDKCKMPLYWDGKGAADHITRSGGTTGSYHEYINPLYKMERAK